jgi:DNA repair exonuclease SbcCD ATPase subunit
MILSKVRFKNFFSSGNAFVEIDLLKYSRSIISGKNGEGKSTVLSAITFAGFGKTIKQVTKPQIVNSINNKNCLVELEGSKGSKSFLIRRGIKPAVFEIFEDGVLVDQTLVGEYQTYLEERLFGCSFRTFLQTSVISIENYKPFMSLTAGERRAFIEDILDIKVFSAMNQMVKSENSKNKETIRVVDTEYKTLREKIATLKSHIEQVESIALESTAAIDEEIERVEGERETALNALESISAELEGTRTLSKELSVLRGSELRAVI